MAVRDRTGIRRLAMEWTPPPWPGVREHNLAWIREQGVASVDLGVVYALASGGRRPPVTPPG